MRLIHSLGTHKVPFALEQPIGSYMWKDRKLAAALKKYGASFWPGSMCAFGERYRKNTLIAVCGPEDYGILGDRHRSWCTGKHGTCSFSGRKHIWLEGASTTRAAQYPARLAGAIAKCLLSSWRLGAT